MTARTVPTLPTWTAGQRVLASQLQSITTYGLFQSSPPSFRMYQAIAQSIANNTWTQITCDTSVYDSDTGRGGSTPWAYTIPTGMAGRWQFSVKSGWASNATGMRAAALYKNGSPVADMQVNEQAATGQPSFVLSTGTPVVAAGDVMSIWGFQSSGGALNTDATSFSTFEGRLASWGSP